MVIEMTEQRAKFVQLVTIAGRLKLELKGLTSRVNTLAVAQALGYKAKTRKAMLPLVQADIAKMKTEMGIPE